MYQNLNFRKQKSSFSVFICLFLGFLFSMNVLNAQSQRAHCGTDEHYTRLEANNPAQVQLRKQADALSNAHQNLLFKATDTTTKVIPVVFHVLHTYGVENISKQNILDQLTTLNQNFNATNSDTANVAKVFKSRIGKVKYKFVLATKDPNGKCTDGIEHIYSTKTYRAGEDAKSVSYWDNSKYLNIWVVHDIDPSFAGGIGTVLGYAQFPYDAANKPKTDGIIVVYYQVKSGANTLTHEIGHWCGLYHTFQGGCYIFGDQVDDTPPTKDANFGCPTNQNTCSSEKPDVIDMIENFMDYSDCSHMFTKGQKTRMDDQMTTYRSTIYSASNLKSTGVDTSYKGTNCLSKADFDIQYEQICTGLTTTYSDASYNASPASYFWTFKGGNPATSTDPNPTVKYDTSGIYDVRLQVTSAGGTSTKTRSSIIKVIDKVAEKNTPFNDGFESNSPISDNNYKVSSDFYKQNGWAISNSVGFNSNKSLYINNASNTSYNVKYWITLPSVDMTKSINHKLLFKVAYAQKAAGTDDNLQVQLSLNCGASWLSTAYNKSGSTLATVQNTVGGSFIPSDSTQWRSESINLNSYRFQKALQIRFQFVTDLGNNLYIDNINIGSGVVGIEDQSQQKAELSVYPNPANSDFNIKMNAPHSGKLNIVAFDLQGRKLGQLNEVPVFNGQQEIKVNKEQFGILNNGLYLLLFDFGTYQLKERVIIAP